MHWIILIILSGLLSSCIFVEGQIVEEPQDVVISPQSDQITTADSCQSQNVTHPNRTVRCKHCLGS